MGERLNTLNGKDWLQYSFSIWRDIKKGPLDNDGSHPAPFPVELPRRILKIFTKPGEWVLDPFMGSGSTAVASLIEQRNCVGIELSEKFYQVSKKRTDLLSLEKYSNPSIQCELFNGDSLNLEKYVKPSSIDICITSPPYWDILNRKRSADKRETRTYSNSESDLGNISDYDEFLKDMAVIFAKVKKSLKPKGYCIIIVMDIRKGSKFYPFHSDLSRVIIEEGFEMKDLIIWDRQKEYNSMRPLGYPYSFVVNKVHEYVLIFKNGGTNGIT